MNPHSERNAATSLKMSCFSEIFFLRKYFRPDLAHFRAANIRRQLIGSTFTHEYGHSSVQRWRTV